MSCFLKKVVLTMKITAFLLFITALHVSATVYSQNTKLSIDYQNKSIKEVLHEIESQSEFRFIYENEKINLDKKVNITVEDHRVEDILDVIFSSQGINYTITENNLILIDPVNTIPGSTNSEQETNASQQKIKVNGTVTATDGSLLTGVTVVLKGTTIGTITDADGNYSLEGIPATGSLVFSFIGMESKELSIEGKSTINVQLNETNVGIEEVIAIAYGTQKRRDITGSVQNVDAEKLENLPVGQFAQKLQGQVAGVQINQTTGQPGEGMLFKIRGATSINADNQPLIVVDGFPLVGDINTINPDEIESYTVLKDAAATSLYGSRAGNGVILITTKRAKMGKTQMKFDFYYGFQSVPEAGRPDLMNAQQFAKYEKEFFEDKIKYEGWTNADGDAIIPEVYQNPSQYGEGTDWYDVMLRTAPVQSYTLSTSSHQGDFLSSTVGSYFKQEGVVLNTKFERYSLRSNNQYKLNEKINVGFNIAPSVQISNNHATDGYRAIIGTATTVSPILSPWDENGELRLVLSAPNMFEQPNWYRVLEERENNKTKTNLLSGAFVEVNIIDGLKYKFQTGIELGNVAHRSFTPSTVGGKLGSAPPQDAYGTYNTQFYYSWTTENILTYNKSIGDHNFELLAGYTAQEYKWESSSIQGTDYPDDEISWLDAAATITGGSNTTAWSMLSYLSRLNYNYKNKYYLQATFRRDGSSRFGPNNRWSSFPSISLGWIASEEDFLKNNSFKMNYLKLRASYGLTGNNNIGNYTYIAGVNSTNYVFNNALVSGKSLSGLGNSELTWEATNQFDVGADFGFFNDRIFFQYDYYYKSTDNLLYQLDVPRASGFSSVQYNIGQIDFWGHELSVETKNLIGDFRWNTSLNMAISRNEVIALGTENTPIGGYSNAGSFNRLQVGEPVGIFMGYIYDGVYMTQEEFNSQPKHSTSTIGTARMKDVSKDGVINSDDRTIIGNPNPDMIFGITNQFYWKKFDLSVVLSGVIGGDIIDRAYENSNNLDGVFNVTSDVANRWRSPENPGNGEVPRTLSGTTELFRYNNTRWVSDGTHLAIKNITLGYTVNPKKYISKARFYFSGQQLAFLTKYKGGNPEVGASMNWNGLGVDNAIYPVPRTITFGCNVTF